MSSPFMQKKNVRQTVSQSLSWKMPWDVPAGVCGICGEKYFKAEVVKAMEKTANSKWRPEEVIEVPIRELKVV